MLGMVDDSRGDLRFECQETAGNSKRSQLKSLHQVCTLWMASTMPLGSHLLKHSVDICLFVVCFHSMADVHTYH